MFTKVQMITHNSYFYVANVNLVNMPNGNTCSISSFPSVKNIHPNSNQSHSLSSHLRSGASRHVRSLVRGLVWCGVSGGVQNCIGGYK